MKHRGRRGGGSSLESEILNIESRYLHFICFAMDFVNSSQCCKAEKKENKVNF